MKNAGFKVIGVVIILLAIGFGGKYLWSQIKSGSVASLNSSSYYAVFLSNDQVYFGHLSDVNNQYVSLKDIYYLQLAQPLQSTDAKDTTTLLDNSKQQLTLIKLGKELHAPKDEMKINRDSVLFYEELKDDSKVVQTIKKAL